jgi:hypothetical protein
MKGMKVNHQSPLEEIAANGQKKISRTGDFREI